MDRQANTTSYIKTFKQYIPSSVAEWVYKKINGTKYITTADKKVDVYIENNLYVNGSINTPSDIRLKDNIDDLTNDYCDEILKINPIKYTFKNDIKHQIHFGVSAQELEMYFPELVANGEITNENEIKSVNYLELIPILIVKMKSMQQKIDDLEFKVNNKM